MKDLTKIYIDLSKCSEEQQEHIFSLLPEKEFDNQYRIDDCHFRLSFEENDSWWVYNDKKGVNKTELTYPEFIKLFEGGEEETFPTNVDIWKWWETQKFQKEQGEQEYTMIYEIDLPKILKSFFTHFNLKTKDNGNT